MWNRFEKQHLSHLKPDDIWVYARKYKSGTGYKGGQTNSLVLNFKKSPSKRGTHEWSYREKAIKQFKEDVEPLLKTNPYSGVLTAVPSSKTNKNKFLTLIVNIDNFIQFVLDSLAPVKQVYSLCLRENDVNHCQARVCLSFVHLRYAK